MKYLAFMLFLLVSCASMAQERVPLFTIDSPPVSRVRLFECVIPVAETADPVVEPSPDYFIVFVTTNCGPCESIKRRTIPSVRKAGYKVGIIDISDQPQWGLRNAPHVWRCNDRKQLQTWSGFVNAETLLNSVRTAKAITVIHHDPATDSAVKHLREVHGIEAGGKSYTELEAIHDADHIRMEGGRAGNYHFPGKNSL